MDIRLPGSEWLAGWRKETGHLFLPMPLAPRLGVRVAIRVELADQPICATVIGTIASVCRQGEKPRIEFAPEEESLPAVRMLGAAALGERFRFSQRHIRYLIRLPVLITCDQQKFYATTLSISRGGCALRWPNPLPDMGQPVHMRYRIGSRNYELTGSVCWLKAGNSTGCVGVRFEDSISSGGITGLVAEARRMGAPQV